MEFLKSASKIVLIVMCIATIAWLFTWNVESDQFMNLAVMVFTYYFVKNDKTQPWSKKTWSKV